MGDANKSSGSTPQPRARGKKRTLPNDETNHRAEKRANNGSQHQSGGSRSVANHQGDHVLPDIVRIEDLMKKYAEIQTALEKEKASNAQLQEQLDKAVELQREGNNEKDCALVPRPKGTAGTDFSIQIAMGLSGSTKKYDKYKAIQRNLRDLMLNARINWELPWAEVPAKDKALLFDIASEQNPFLGRFVNDWATEEIVKQYAKNKRKNHYDNGWLEVPQKYAHLKGNASKRNPTASRKKRAFSDIGGGTKNANKGSAVAAIARNGKTKAIVVDEEDNDEQHGGSAEEDDHP